MSSFNINGPSNQPIIQGAQNLGKDGGGGGNTGYMNMRKKKKNEKKENSEENSIIIDNEQEDTFTRQDKTKDNENNNLLKTLASFIHKKDTNKNNNKDVNKDDIFTKSTKETFDPENTDITNKIFSKDVNDDFYKDVDI